MTSLTPLLSLFTRDQIRYLAKFGESLSFGEGETVIRQGDTNEYLYLVLTGSLNVTRHTDGASARLGTIGQGQTIGEVSIFDPGPSSATVEAREETETWRISETQLEKFREEHPLLAYDLVTRIAKCLSERLRGVNERFANAVAEVV